MWTVLAVSVFSLLSSDTQEALTTCGVDETALEQFLSYDQHSFDQGFGKDEQKSWRSISKMPDCDNAAGELIKAYMQYSHPYQPTGMAILRWHAGQVKAQARKTDEAIALMRGTYDPDAEKSGPEWNYYVDGTLAFLRRDKKALIAARDKLAAIPVTEEEKASRRKYLEDHPEIEMYRAWVDEPQNLSVLEALIECFDRPYADAYGFACREDLRAQDAEQ